MRPKTLYLSLCVPGAVLPYGQFLPWLAGHGLNLPLFFREMWANRIGAFFALDVLISAAALLVFIGVENARRRVRLCWLPVVAVLTVGVSLGLPLFLFLRERSRAAAP